MEKLFLNISFIGGIHGVGKSTICKSICADLNIEYLSASEVLKWVEINEDSQEKKVQNIALTQNRLIKGLQNRVEKEHHYLLDGHYCLLDNSEKIIKVPFETFQAINPSTLHLIVSDITEIKSRLELRDKRIYDYSLLKNMQDQEIEYAKELSHKLNIDLTIGQQDNYCQILDALKLKVL
jgi:adenylate kinase